LTASRARCSAFSCRTGPLPYWLRNTSSNTCASVRA